MGGHCPGAGLAVSRWYWGPVNAGAGRRAGVGQREGYQWGRVNKRKWRVPPPTANRR
jgi:hypothetical protein